MTVDRVRRVHDAAGTRPYARTRGARRQLRARIFPLGRPVFPRRGHFSHVRVGVVTLRRAAIRTVASPDCSREN
jgi:hypothetical protein